MLEHALHEPEEKTTGLLGGCPVKLKILFIPPPTTPLSLQRAISPRQDLLSALSSGKAVVNYQDARSPRLPLSASPPRSDCSVLTKRRSLGRRT